MDQKGYVRSGTGHIEGVERPGGREWHDTANLIRHSTTTRGRTSEERRECNECRDGASKFNKCSDLEAVCIDGHYANKIG
jgi:hypothetical protein